MIKKIIHKYKVPKGRPFSNLANRGQLKWTRLSIDAKSNLLIYFLGSVLVLQIQTMRIKFVSKKSLMDSLPKDMKSVYSELNLMSIWMFYESNKKRNHRQLNINGLKNSRIWIEFESAKGQYFHFLCEVIPWILKLRLEVFIEKETCEKVSFISGLLDYYKIEYRCLPKVPSGDFYSVKNMKLKLTSLGIYSYYPNANFLNEALRNHQQVNRGYILFLIRRNNNLSRGRGIVNQTEIEKCFSNQVKFICLEEMTTIDQIQIFSDAKMIIGVHGAGLSNMVFMPKKSKVLELFPSTVIKWHFGILAKICEHEYSMKVLNNEDQTDSISIPIALIKKEINGLQ